MSDRSQLYACAIEAEQTIIGYDDNGDPIYPDLGSDAWVRAYREARESVSV